MGERQRQRSRWVWYGGRLSIDFVNTLRDRFAGGRELLCAPEDLAAWCEAAGLTGEGRIAVDERALMAARELREAVDAGVVAVVREQPFPPAAVRTLNDWLAHDPGEPPRLELADGVPVLRSEPPATEWAGALHRIAADAAEILGGDGRARLRICDGVGCSARFVDKSVGRRRRWCQMATCGNRAKAAQFRRSATAGGASPA
ncbi:ABATE domain-containing protein [Streptomyces sp. MST-110588]|uniref:CGNR zinc finger domain-containing protein n=1 Tax=Streptomyces sp. MST-110588 TaxID=2833628 RepID=UPI001F5D6189|nr:ABATE domain-containing protein [Streptomyces sp. MST-110588]UNO41856.1 ABATE domain-containing protein [Streptomyces sp. MST-110588]